MQLEYNKAMIKVRSYVEWVYGEIFNYFKFLDFQKLKKHLSGIGKMYCVLSLLTNAHTCLYKSLTSEYFDVEPLFYIMIAFLYNANEIKHLRFESNIALMMLSTIMKFVKYS